jgi:hypothetical protein
MPNECLERIETWIRELFGLEGDDLTSTIQTIVNCAKMKKLVSCLELYPI